MMITKVRYLSKNHLGNLQGQPIIVIKVQQGALHHVHMIHHRVRMIYRHVMAHHHQEQFEDHHQHEDQGEFLSRRNVDLQQVNHQLIEQEGDHQEEDHERAHQ
jgi:hypothetical protein